MSRVLVAAGLLVVLISLAVGVTVDLRMAKQAAAQDTQHLRAVAHLLVDAPAVGSTYADASPVMVPASWSDRRGGQHTGLVAASQGLRAGSVVTIWTDVSGAKVAAPASAGQALVGGVVAGGMALGGGFLVLVGLWALVRRATLAANCARWEQEWREIAPSWTRGDDKRD
ncbi:MAG: hypothetical protein JOY78_21145 [Pseudonocardia sp.]|nr:hypothetical protein [Pseudonocardia sp.]